MFERWSEPTPMDLEALVPIYCNSFGAKPDDVHRWYERIDPSWFRVITRGEEVLAGMFAFPSGHFLGGRSVPCACVAGVVVRADVRGSGVGLAMMRRFLQELSERGVPLSSLYAATHGFYRKVGYQAAGTRSRARMASSWLPRFQEPEVVLHPLREADRAECQELFARMAPRSNGHLEREAYLWPRVWLGKHDEVRDGAVARVDGQVRGYVVYTQSYDTPGARLTVDITDLQAADAPTARALWTYLARHRSVVDAVHWWSSVSDPLLQLLPEPRLELTLMDSWALRVVDPVAALQQRGWAPGRSGRVHLHLTDALLPQRGGDWLLSVDSGQATVERGGEGRVRLDPRGLAAMYTGHLGADQAVRAGLAEGPEADLALLEGLLAGPAPWMPEMF